MHPSELEAILALDYPQDFKLDSSAYFYDRISQVTSIDIKESGR